MNLTDELAIMCRELLLRGVFGSDDLPRRAKLLLDRYALERARAGADALLREQQIAAIKRHIRETHALFVEQDREFYGVPTPPPDDPPIDWPLPGSEPPGVREAA